MNNSIIKTTDEVLDLLPRTVNSAFCSLSKWLVNGRESLQLTAEAIKKKVKQIPEDKLVEPEPYVAIPAIQQISYCQNSEELRDLYANLLTSSMNSDEKWQVHPSFVDIIKQITPDEAKIIKSIPNFKNNFIPAIDVKLTEKNASNNGYQIYITNFTTIGFDVIENKENICSYIDNLVRLNILEIPPTYYLTNESLYKPLEESPLLEKMIPQTCKSIYDIGYKHKVIGITNYGLQFKRICCK